MNDRDDHPDNPYRGRVNRERGDDYDPLGGPPPEQQRPRGRRARPEPPDWNDAPDTGGFRASRHAPGGDGGYDPLGSDAPPTGRRHRPGPPADGPPGPARRGGAADALRGGRAARSGAAHSGAPYSEGQGGDPRAREHVQSRHAGPAQDPTQDALAALAGLGEPAAPSGPAETTPRGFPGAEEPPRGRRARPEPEPEPAPDPEPPAQEESRGRRRGGRRRRGAPADEPPAEAAAPPVEEEPRGRRPRRKRGRRDEPTGSFLDDAPEDSGVFDSGTFPGVSSSADTGAFAAVEGPSGSRRSRRSRSERDDRRDERDAWDDRSEGSAADTGAFPGTDAFAAVPEAEPDSGAFEEQDFEEEPEPRPRRSRRRRAAVEEEDDKPRGRRRGGRRRRGAPVDDAPPEPEVPEETDESFSEELPEEAPEEEPEPRPRRSRRASAADDAPSGRRGGRRRRGRREEPEPEPEEEPEEYEEPNLADIAEAYGGGRRSRKKAKELKRARANAGKGGRKRRKNKGMVIAMVLLLLLIVAGGYFVVRTYFLPADFEGQGSGEVTFVIEEGDAGSVVGSNLVDAGVVASTDAFLTALEDSGGGLVPGTYSLAEGMSSEAAVAALLDPESRLGAGVTIREGLRTSEIFEEVAAQTNVSVDQLNEAYAQTEELGLPDYASEGPEGYLFPSTYRFDPGTDAMSMLKTMVTQHNRVAEEIDLEGGAAELGFDANEIMAIASIVQAESGNKEDMPLISAVVHNRMDEGWPLEMDSTCFYELGTHGLALTEEQQTACKNDPGDYGTYGRVGLPVGPFVAPGKSAIEAALAPADVDYMFFALVNPETGETGFSTTLEEHNQMVAENQHEW